jgi:PBSX family phage terminase large subunit
VLNSFKLFQHQLDYVMSKDKYPFLLGGYGSGKTYGFCVFALNQCSKNAGKTILLAEPTYPMVRDVLQPTFETVLRQAGFDYEYTATSTKYRVYWKNGWCDVIMRSAENYMRWAGLNLAAGGIDEADQLRDDRAWKMLLSRLRDGNTLTAFGSGTPEGFKFVYKYWAENPTDGYKLIRGRTEDNTMLPEEFIDSLKQNYDETLLKAYLNGEFVNLQQGATYYNFKRETNVKKNEYNKLLPIRICIDFNVSPMAATLLHLCENNRPEVRVFDEVELHHSGGAEILTERMVQEIKSRYPNNKYIAYPDPANQRHTSALHTDHDILRQGGFDVRVKPKAPRVIDSVNAVNKACQDNLIIDPRCKGLIADLEQTVNKEGTREIDKGDKQRTHFTDGLRYFIDYERPIIKPIVGSIQR